MVWLCVHNENIQFHHRHILHVSINHTGAQEKYYVYLHYLSISFVCAMWCDSFLSEPETLFVCLLSEMRVNLLFTQNVFVCFSRWVSASLTISLFVSFMIMSNFFLWNSARHFFHHGLCDLRSSCRISMHQLGCQDLWHTYTQIENGNGNANKTTARKKKCGRFLNCYNWWSKILSSAAWNRNRTIIEIIKNSLKTFFKLEREWKRIGMLDLI